ncbi:Lrp/AsnC family transcriptional regulator [Halosolutus amylolyticus]|uniref:Lrp/AsnC family transcriptional regulator n=1 Tax=Halosolutus amylolyticus TaxID=2932267 RepID=A0ABD5PU44_9EURY|nr:Lrp/AsnC family transcriptional regulator [Halosolutus amylolyticus]
MGDSDTIDRELLLAVLDESQPATVPDLAASLDAHPMTVERHCERLQRSGEIRQCTGGAYTLSEGVRTDRTAAD